MNKQKLKYLPYNFLFCITSWFVPFLILSQYTSVDIYLTIIISSYIYLNDVAQSSKNDYFEERIKKLEEDQK